MSKTCIIYTRFSPRKNSGESESCEIQAAQCGKFAAEKEWSIGGVYEDKGDCQAADH